MTRKPLTDRLDDSVRWTGIPALAEGTVRRRHLRVVPSAALLFAIGGLALSLANPLLLWPGFAFSMSGLSLSLWGPVLGPIKPWNSPQRVDEFDRDLRARAYLATLPWTTLVAGVALMFVPTLALVLRWPEDMLRMILLQCGLLIGALICALPTLHASLTVRKSIEADDDD